MVLCRVAAHTHLLRRSFECGAILYAAAATLRRGGLAATEQNAHVSTRLSAMGIQRAASWSRRSCSRVRYSYWPITSPCSRAPMSTSHAIWWRNV